MSKESEIMREHIRTHRTVLSMCNEPEDVILNRLLDDFDSKDQRIAELEEQLRNSRVKFLIGFDSDFNLAVKELDLNIVLPNWMHDKEFKFYDTKEEALAKLRELQEK